MADNTNRTLFNSEPDSEQRPDSSTQLAEKNNNGCDDERVLTRADIDANIEGVSLVDNNKNALQTGDSAEMIFDQ